MSRPDLFMMRKIDDIKSAFSRVKASAEKAVEGEELSKEQAFQDIFALNNEIGRTGRERPEMMPKMKELQLYVNMITVGLKYDKAGDVLEGLSLTEKSIAAVAKDFSAMP
jgi:hypothetical protein